jgi:serine/threonine-protein kinase
VELDKRLPAILSGQKQPANTAEQLEFAQLCQMACKQQFAAAARFYGQAFAAEPKLAADLRSGHRYNAACAAAQAGCGKGKDAGKLDVKDRNRLRKQALDWLAADLNAWRQVLAKFLGKAGPGIVQQMRHWQQDADFAGVRGEVLARLPEAERQPWQKLWADVADLLAEARGKIPAKEKPKDNPDK